MNKRFPILLISSLVTVGVAGCSSVSDEGVLPDRKVEYQKTQAIDRDLEIPPDLTKSTISDAYVLPDAGGVGSATYSDFVNRERSAQRGAPPIPGASAVLPEIKNVELKRDGDQRWLEIQSKPEDVWGKVVAYWRENGILLVEQNPAVGVMVTDWIENRANIKNDPITDMIRGVFDGLYSSSTRDQYRIRLERGTRTGTTELYLTQRGMVQKGVRSTTGESDQIAWVPTDADHGLEVEMLSRLMVYLGVSEATAKAQAERQERLAQTRSEMVKGQGKVSMNIKEGFARSWRLTGVALDRVGFVVEDRDQEKGVYYVRYNDPMADQEKGGLLSGLAFWKSDEVEKDSRYQVTLQPQGDATRVSVRNEAGEELSDSTAERILTLLHEQLR